MTSTIQGVSLKERLITEFELQRSALLLDNPLLDNFRNASIKAFESVGFPSKKHEEYRYLNLDKELNEDLSTPFSLDAKDEESFQFDGSLIPENAIRISLINGFFSKQNSEINNLPKGLIIKSLADAIRENDKHVLSVLGTLAKPSSDAFIALNSALFMDGLFIYVEKGHSIDNHIHISQEIHPHNMVFSQTRILLVCEENSNVQVVHHIKTKETNPSGFSNTVIEAEIERGAKAEWLSIQEESSNSAHVITTQAQVFRNAEFKHISFGLQGKLIRNNLNVVLEDSNCESHLYGYYHPSQNEVIDNHTLVDHRKPHCNSNELYKGVVDGNGTAVFNGKIYVQQDAQKTNAFQSNKNILLSEGATVNTKPQLEIYADDVKCSHGSSTGILDPDQLFYLRSRGLSLEKARALLLSAYAGEIIEEVSNNSLREALIYRIEKLISA
ncbi:MAG: Fe-S cluster assembly protein SufD [Bacteroidia bacterium]